MQGVTGGGIDHCAWQAPAAKSTSDQTDRRINESLTRGVMLVHGDMLALGVLHVLLSFMLSSSAFEKPVTSA